MQRHRLSFGPFDFDPIALELRRNGRRLRLRPQSAQALALLVANAGEEVSREALRDHLWGEGTYLDHETAINTCIRRLRAILGRAPSAATVEGARSLDRVRRFKPVSCAAAR